MQSAPVILYEANVSLDGGRLVADPMPGAVLVRINRSLREAFDVVVEHAPLLFVGDVLHCPVEVLGDQLEELRVVAGRHVECGALKILGAHHLWVDPGISDLVSDLSLFDSLESPIDPSLKALLAEVPVVAAGL